MKTIDKKLSARPPVFHRALTGIARKPQADIERRQIGQILRNNTVQAKLTIGQPNDKYEQEADRVADEVMSMPDPKLQRQENPEEEEEEAVQTKPLTEGITPLVQRQEEPEEEEEEPVQTKPLAEGITPLLQRQEEPEEEEEEA